NRLRPRRTRGTRATRCRARRSRPAACSSGGGRGARVAHAAQHDIVAGDRVAGLLLDLAQRRLELVVGERLDLAAVAADEVVMVLTVRMNRLEARRPGPDVDPVEEPVAAELLERAIDACDADATAAAAELVEDLLRRQAALLSAEQFDHGSPRAAVAVTTGAKRCERRLRPAVLAHGP